MEKIHIYFMPGLAAGPKIFENLVFDESLYELHFLKWIQPLTINENISNYAERLANEVKQKNIVLVGVSFGGIMVQEMSKFLKPKKIIIISSVKSNLEFPKRFKLASASKLYKLFPTKIVSDFESFKKFFLGKSLKKKAKIYEKYLSERNEIYLKWSIYNVLHWQQTESPPNIIHIHGTNDLVFPITNISNAIKIEKGTHIMIITKAKKISRIIHEKLSALSD